MDTRKEQHTFNISNTEISDLYDKWQKKLKSAREDDNEKIKMFSRGGLAVVAELLEKSRIRKKYHEIEDPERKQEYRDFMNSLGVGLLKTDNNDD